MSEDRSGISFWNHSLDTCKKYCHKGNIVVEEYSVKSGWTITFSFHPKWFRLRIKEVLFSIRHGSMTNLGWVSIAIKRDSISEYGKAVFENIEQKTNEQ